MSVLIKGMEMPESCVKCELMTANYGCTFVGAVGGESYRKRAWDCPLVEVPPHGPLVDSNRLIDIGLHLMHTAKNDDIANGVKWLWQYIIEAPTIIESEGDG